MHAVVADQNSLTSSVLNECETRQQFNKLLTELFDYPSYSCPKRHGKRCRLKLLLPTFKGLLLILTAPVGIVPAQHSASESYLCHSQPRINIQQPVSNLSATCCMSLTLSRHSCCEQAFVCKPCKPQPGVWLCYRYHYSYNTGLQAQGVLYSQAGVDDEGNVLLDPNKLSEDGTVGLD